MRVRRDLLFSLLILLLTLLAYANSFEASFHHDDIHTIVRNSHIKDPAQIPRFFFHPEMGSGIYTATSSYRPLLLATFALNYSLGGLKVFGYHLFNFALHAGCALLLYFILLRLSAYAGRGDQEAPLGHRLTALFGALLFALHPVQTESVTYITGRSSLLTGFFFLASFGAYLQSGLTGGRRYAILSWVFFAAALLVKETAVVLVVLLGLLDFLFPRGRTWRDRFWNLLPLVLLALVYLGARIYFFGSLNYTGDPLRPFVAHLLTQPRAWVHYLGTLLFPLNLNLDYDFPVSHSFLDEGVILSISLLLGLGAGVAWLGRSNRLVIFWAAWFVLNLLPTNSLIILEDLVSDRWLYLSTAGYAALLAYAAGWIFQNLAGTRSRAPKIAFFFLCALIVELYGFSTAMRNFTWRNDRALWEDTVAKSPQKARPYSALGVALALEGKLEPAVQNLKRAIELAPQGGQAYINLGYVYGLQGKTKEAIAAYEEAIPLNPKLLPEIYNNLGLIYYQQGQLERAETLLRRAVEIRPHYAPPYCNLAALYEKRGDSDRAIEYYEKTVRLAPDYGPAFGALSVLYAQKGWKEKSQDARDEFLRHSRR